jgi:hypothetical protein
MWNDEGPRGPGVGRTLVTILGVLGAFVALDALLAFLALLVIPMFVGSQNPYVGLLLFIVLPVAAVLGAVLAWAAYVVVSARADHVDAGQPHART